jgi:membrane-associated protein
MDLLKDFIDFVLHLDKNLVLMVKEYGTLTYVILFFIIFAETGFVVTPFLPGDSLLFAAGAVAKSGDLNIVLLIVLIYIAAVLGNTVNYMIGAYLGPAFLEKEKIPFIKKEHLVKTHAFYEKHGARAVILSRFLPIFRTFVPFVAGIGQMDWRKFSLYNMIGAAFWVVPLTIAGYLFGQIPYVQKNFSVIIIAIIVITALPAIATALNEYRSAKKAKRA